MNANAAWHGEHSQYKWIVVGMLWAICFLNYADRQAIFTVFPAIHKDLRLTDWELGLAGSAFMWVYALAGPAAGWLGDRLSRKWIIIAALLFWSATTAATGYAHTFYDLLALRGLGGLGEAFYFPAAMSLLSDVHSARTRSRAMSIHQTAVYAGSIAGASVTGYVADSHGWRSSFFVFGAAGLLLGTILIAALREPARQLSEGNGNRLESRRNLFASLIEIALNTKARLLILAFMGANFVAVVFLTWMPSYLVTAFGLGMGAAGLRSSASLQAASVIGVLLGGWIADYWAKATAGGRVLTQATALLCGVPFLILTGWTISLPILVVALTGFGLFKGAYDANIFASLHDVTAPERRGSAAGTMNSLGWLAGGIAPIAVAWGAGRVGFRACLIGTAGIYLSAALTLIRATRLGRKGIVSAPESAGANSGAA